MIDEKVCSYQKSAVMEKGKCLSVANSDISVE